MPALLCELVSIAFPDFPSLPCLFRVAPEMGPLFFTPVINSREQPLGGQKCSGPSTRRTALLGRITQQVESERDVLGANPRVSARDRRPRKKSQRSEERRVGK